MPTEFEQTVLCILEKESNGPGAFYFRAIEYDPRTKTAIGNPFWAMSSEDNYNRAKPGDIVKTGVSEVLGYDENVLNQFKKR